MQKGDRFRLVWLDGETLTGVIVAAHEWGWDAWVNNGGFIISRADVKSGRIQVYIER